MESRKRGGSVAADADNLFKKHAVVEIKDLLVKLRTDADRKKSDLRLMVGERFRDVIDAAEAIRTMKTSVESMVGAFSEIKQLCEPAHLEARVKEETKDQADERTTSLRAQMYPIASQIRLLVMTPEMIWQFIEKDCYVQSSQIFHISRLIHASLTSNQNKLLARFPVIQQQWDAISPLRSQIAEKATSFLSKYDVDDEKLISATLAIMLLENSSIESGLDKLLSARTLSISELSASLSKKSMGESDKQMTLANELLKFVQIIVSTLSSVAKLYLSHPHDPSESEVDGNSINKSASSRISDALKDLQSARTEQSSLVKELYSGKENVTLLFRHLPLSIQRYTPRVMGSSDQSGLTNDSVYQKVSQWLEKVFQTVQRDVPASLISVKTSNDLSNTCRLLLQLLKSYDSNSASTQPNTNSWRSLITQESFSFWTVLYQKGFTQRGIELVESTMQRIQQDPLFRLQSEIAQITSDTKSIPLNLSLFGLNQGKNSKTGVAGKNQWVSANVQSVVEQFELACKRILDDLTPFLNRDSSSRHGWSGSHEAIAYRRLSTQRNPKESSQENLDLTDIAVQAPEIKEYVATAFQNCVRQFQKLVLAELSKFKVESPSENEPSQIDKILFIGRCARGITFSLRRLEPQFSPGYPEAQNSGYQKNNLRSRDGKDPASLSESQLIMMEIYTKAYEVWISLLSTRFEQTLENNLRHADFCNAENRNSVWEAVSIEGDTSDSRLRIPIQASRFISKCLMDVMKDLNRIGSYNIEKPSLIMLIDELFHRMFHIFDKFTRAHLENDKMISDKGALQLLFDILYISRIGEGILRTDPKTIQPQLPPNKKSVSETDVQNLLSLVKSRIDPIDLTVIDSHIHDAVDRYYSKTATLLGGILLLNGTPRESRRNATLQEQPSIIALAKPCPRFPLLPISSGLPSRIATSRGLSKYDSPATSATKSGTPAVSASQDAKSSTETHQTSILRPPPPIVIRLTRGVSESGQNTPRVSQSTSHISGKGRVMGLLTGNIPLSAAAQQVKATELFSYISGVWGSSTAPSSIPKK